MECNEVKINDEFIDPIQNITLNPFFMSRIIHAFIQGYEKPSVPFNIIYIVLPIIYYGPSRKLLTKAQSRSSLRTLFVDDIDKATALGDFKRECSILIP